MLSSGNSQAMIVAGVFTSDVALSLVFPSIRDSTDARECLKAAINAAISEGAKMQEPPVRAILHCNNLISIGCGSRICSKTYIAKNYLNLAKQEDK